MQSGSPLLVWYMARSQAHEGVLLLTGDALVDKNLKPIPCSFRSSIRRLIAPAQQ